MIAHPGAQGSDCEVFGAPGDHEDDGEARVAAPQATDRGNIVPAVIRIGCQNDEVGGSRVQGVQRRGGIGGGDDVPLAHGERIPKGLGPGGFPAGDEDSRLPHAPTHDHLQPHGS